MNVCRIRVAILVLKNALKMKILSNVSVNRLVDVVFQIEALFTSDSFVSGLHRYAM